MEAKSPKSEPDASVLDLLKELEPTSVELVSDSIRDDTGYYDELRSRLFDTNSQLPIKLLIKAKELSDSNEMSQEEAMLHGYYLAVALFDRAQFIQELSGLGLEEVRPIQPNEIVT